MDIFNVKAIFNKIPAEKGEGKGVENYHQLYYLFKGLKPKISPDAIDSIIKVIKDEAKEAEKFLLAIKKELSEEKK